MEGQAEILERCSMLFKRYGVRSVTMNDLARELGISKKTLYLHVENKADLIHKVVLHFTKLEDQLCEEIINDSKDAVEEIIRISIHVKQHLRQINPTMIFELEKYYHKSWDFLNSHRVEEMRKVIGTNIQKGIDQGLYRDELDVDMTSRLFVAKLQSIINNDIFPFPEFKPADVHESYIDYHMHAITSSKGLKVYHTHKGKLIH